MRRIIFCWCYCNCYRVHVPIRSEHGVYGTAIRAIRIGVCCTDDDQIILVTRTDEAELEPYVAKSTLRS